MRNKNKRKTEGKLHQQSTDYLSSCNSEGVAVYT